ncbi:M16 family metallopeptidase [Treponema brennaborense]|uniref:Peptidase M16 domain protein n=1 Tax=Treponema brennaborense (strain DSM 12168 / CIP 105900 / DD5/3) TaxID=906968 RepID=F4LLX9_TREBD|nr:M16 family metallopeptidase [Treponema brennaborense]AEE15671.1 peptidase M16 domain protein [Treponema brennaborense DSM 12168]
MKTKSLQAALYRAVICLAAGFILAGCVSGTKPELSQPLEQDAAVLSGTLENGMSYYVKRNAKPENRIMLRLAVNAGSNMEEDDQKGVAHLVEHMAFNGSEHFAENELINYFESIGMAFGPEVNAYTSFDETVYMIEVPADNPEMLAQGMTVLRDWACGLLFDPVELDKERGVVTEEWRLRRGLSGRLSDKQIPFLLKDSRYAERLPIGDMEVIKNVSRERVVDFYEKWYRPELMSVVLVGDIDPAVMEQAIVSAMASVPASQKKVQRPEYDVKAQKEEAVLVIRDPEQPYTLIQILEQMPALKIETEAQFRQNLVYQTAFAIFNARLAELTYSDNPLWFDAAAFSTEMTRSSAFNALALVPKEGLFTQALTALLDELDRITQFGITESELDRVKRESLSAAEQDWLNRNNVESANVAAALVNHALTGQPVVSADTDYELMKRFIPSITAAEVDGAIRDGFTNRGTLFIAAVPDAAQDVPSDEEILNIWLTHKSEEPLTPYGENDIDRPLTSLPAAVGSVIATETVPGTNIVRRTLSNGAHVLTLKTDFKTNEVLFSAVSRGGASVAAEADVPSALLATDYLAMSGLNGFSATDLQKKLAGKQVSVSPYIGSYTEGLSGSAAATDLETLMQLVRSYFTEPYFTDTGWNNLTTTANLIASSRSAQPQTVFQDKITEILYGGSLRKSALTPEFAARLNRETAERIYRERFADAADFTFIFVGDFNEDELVSLAETYIATLPAAPVRAGENRTPEQAVFTEPEFPAGKPAATVRKGLEKQSSVFIAFGGRLPAADAETSRIETELFEMLRSLLDIRLRESIREDKSGTYGVSVNGSFYTYPERAYEMQISFGCEPGREQELADDVIAEIARLQTQLTDESYMTKLKETYRRTKETALKTNGYWISSVTQAVIEGTNPVAVSDTETIPTLVTPQTMRDLANTYLHTDNYVTVFLEPEI